MKDLLEGKTGKVKVLAKFATRDTEEGTSPDWSDPISVTLNVERRSVSLKRAKYRGQFAGDILLLNVEDFVWAEYGENDRNEGEYVNSFMTENFRMEILSLTN